MPRDERTITIAAPIDRVFAIVSDPRMNPRWSSMLESATLTSDLPIRVGTTFRASARLLGRHFESDAVVTEWEDNARVCIRSTSGPIPTAGCRIVEPAGEGTRLTQTLDVEIGGFFGIAEPVVLRIGLRQLESDLATLKDLIESGALQPMDADS